MPSSRLLAAILVFGAGSLSAQQSHPIAHTADLRKPLPLGLPDDSAKLAAAIRASYYHPDDLSVLDCSVALDLTNLVKQFGQPAGEEALKSLNGMTIQVHAVREQSPKIDIAWAQGIPAKSENFESGARQILNGFFQMYWPIFGSSLGPRPLEKFQAEVQPGGGHLLRSTGNNMNVTTEVNGDNIPTSVVIESAAMNATIQPRFSASENPQADDLPRLTSVDFSQQIGTTTMNLRLTTDYQDVGGFHIPRHISSGIGGAYSVSMEFVGCSATR